MFRENGKKIIAALLLVSCIVSGIILISTPAYKRQTLESDEQLDEIIMAHFEIAAIPADKIRIYEIEVDSILTRKTYHVSVPPRFTKTVFHVDLHKALYPFGYRIPARVHFPERDMNLYVYGNNTVQRTIRLITTKPDSSANQ